MEPYIWSFIGAGLGMVTSGIAWFCINKCKHLRIKSNCGCCTVQSSEDTIRTPSNQNASAPELNVV